MSDTPLVLVVHTPTTQLRLNPAPGTTVRDALDATALRVRAACGGNGSCGACAVRLLSGEANPHTLAEYNKLSAAQRAQGWRLACQLRLAGDTEILLDDPAPPSPWRSISPENLAPAPCRIAELEKHVYGVAVDLGTTHIRIALWDRKRGRRIATRRGANPQNSFGADVLNRLSVALTSPQRAAELAQLARDAIIQAVRDILARDVGEVSPMLAEIGQLTLVGNTAMLSLLSGRGSAALIDPHHWQHAIDCNPPDDAVWHAQWRLPHARITMPAPVAGFIGSDLLADLVASGLTDGPPGSLLLDVGTNTEIALWDGRHLHLTAVPGGPAFEGVGLRNGMPAESGAVYGVTFDAGQGSFTCAIIGAEEARGYCGSGLTDAIAALLDAGLLKPSGRFAVAPGEAGYALDPANPRTAITGYDVDAFQRAKAATAAAMETLLTGAGMGWQDIRRLCVCGAFGHHLNIGNAQKVGLLPPIAVDRVELYGDASLAGAEYALLCSDGERKFAELASAAIPINLSYSKGYDDLFIDHLRLRAISPSHPRSQPV